MTQFEFFMAIASVVMAFGLGELARFWGVMIQRGNRGRVGVVRLIWTLYLMLAGVQYWVGMWAYVDLAFLHFRDVFALVVPSLLFVLACHSLTGEMEDDRPEADVYFLANRRVIFCALVAFLVGTVGADLVLLGSDVHDAGSLVFWTGLCGTMLVVAWIEREWLHLSWALANLFLAGYTSAVLPLTSLAGAD